MMKDEEIIRRIKRATGMDDISIGKWQDEIFVIARALLSAGEPAAPADDVIDLAVALEQQRALHIVSTVRQRGFSKSETTVPTQSQSVFDLACEEIEHRLRTETWGLNGVELAPTAATPQPGDPAYQFSPVRRSACYNSQTGGDHANGEIQGMDGPFVATAEEDAGRARDNIGEHDVSGQVRNPVRG